MGKGERGEHPRHGESRAEHKVPHPRELSGALAQRAMHDEWCEEWCAIWYRRQTHNNRTALGMASFILCICRVWAVSGYWLSHRQGSGPGKPAVPLPTLLLTFLDGQTASDHILVPFLRELFTAAPDQVKAFPNRIQVFCGPVLNFKAPDVFPRDHSQSNHLDNL